MITKHSGYAAILLLANSSLAAAKHITVSLAPVANQIHERIQNMPAGMQTLGGVPFDLLPMSGNNSWAAEVGTTPGVQSMRTMILPVDIFGATAVDTLINTSWGVNGSDYVSMQFIGTGGVNFITSLIGGVDIRDWVDGPYTNTINGTTTTQVFQGAPNRPFGTVGRIDKQTIALPDNFANQTLTTIVLIDNGVSGNDDVSYTKSVGGQRAFLYGLTVTAIPEPASFSIAAGLLFAMSVSKCRLNKSQRSSS